MKPKSKITEQDCINARALSRLIVLLALAAVAIAALWIFRTDPQLSGNAVHGLQKVLDGIGSCVDHGASNIAYLSAVLKGEPKKQPDGKKVNAQKYEQRDYDEEQEAALNRMLKGCVG